MRIVVASALFLVATAVACGGKSKKKEEPLYGNEQASESCCCRIEGATPDDETFTLVRVMECSSRNGECLKTQSQCEGQSAPVEAPPDEPAAGEPPPTSF